jgi:response regulator RpfG family c-di-GMP phosphodiesterase
MRSSKSLNFIEEVVKMATQHQESFDDKSYPHALAKDKISYFSRVCKVDYV